MDIACLCCSSRPATGVIGICEECIALSARAVLSLRDEQIRAWWHLPSNALGALGVQRGPDISWGEIAEGKSEEEVEREGNRLEALQEYLPIYLALMAAEDGEVLTTIRNAATYLTLPVRPSIAGLEAIHQRNRELATGVIWGPFLTQREALLERVRIQLQDE